MGTLFGVGSSRPEPPTQTSAVDSADPIRRFCLFEVLDEPARRALAERARKRRYEAGDRIFEFGSPGQSLLAILSGTVRISRPTAKGRDVILGDVAAGQLLGEIAVLDGGPRSAHAIAITRVEALVLERRDVLPFLTAHPELCLKLLELVCGKLRRSDERMSDIGFADLSVRLAKTLLFYYGPRAQTGHRKLAFSQGELADMVGATRESVNRQLREWQRRSIVDMHAGWLIIKDRDELEHLASAG